MKSIDHNLKEKKVSGLMKDKLGEKIMKEFAALILKTYSYLMDDGKMIKKQKEQRRV